ncbi:MAG: hypothetical protein AUJ31_01300 [Parcubacteria group bacterium CG1_02_39_15]|uniref:Helix-turn-helix domain-containing protein n=3 Tax=Candidatus Nealsoniibacteriota TaxID=1817911 RepID=A0A2G9YT51_9BACT|nr:MAG: hypothetical protein AUJ31_01300 [Parcubacteria group bacterium CG1_02_39_15]PIP22342.1 MAG: hypothetical protein COX38_01155 [Candidatus Nealsonbacteria bacterium CG23_combo_of_CG06-09_8_20_14_all_39_25]PIW89974.1 MAG: hypothetical protein COZ92_02060 [Candidatus Nealsonbacteria bacterium CG_4_8_14_3_um_filter_40_11]PIZ87945.1 MAG: hypothetical protein COX91_02885 [Candidatus Nealsonbacteria bacterium CG_4_10_14_0_2_um_filter_39_15]
MKRKGKNSIFFTPQEVANRLRISRATIWRYIREKKIKVIKFTKRTYRISEKDLNAFLKKHHVG